MLLCRAVITGWDGDLAFLFNVLSVAKAFSIQEHPDRKVLHALRLGMYRNANHMAEMVVAVTECRALCYFIGIQMRKLKCEYHGIMKYIKQRRQLYHVSDSAKMEYFICFMGVLTEIVFEVHARLKIVEPEFSTKGSS